MKEKGLLRAVYSRPGFLLKRCHQVAAAIFFELCGDCGLTPSQYGALCALHDFPGIDQIALGRLCGLDRSTIGLVIRLLTERGMIERAVNDHDKRRMQLSLSKAGERLLVDVAPFAERGRDAVLAGLPKEKRKLFVELLEEFLRGHDAVLNPEDIMAGKPYGSRFDEVHNGRLRAQKPRARDRAVKPAARAARGKRSAAAPR